MRRSCEPVGDCVTIKELEGVVQLDKLNSTHAVIVTQSPTGSQDLRTIALP